MIGADVKRMVVVMAMSQIDVTDSYVPKKKKNGSVSCDTAYRRG